MKGFERNNQLLSLCGLNCGLCTMYNGRYCPGCGGGEGNQGCKIARCGIERGNVDYCFRCAEYPCPKYGHIDEYDSFITHRNQKADLEKAEQIGMEALRELLSRLEQCPATTIRGKGVFALDHGLKKKQALPETVRD